MHKASGSPKRNRKRSKFKKAISKGQEKMRKVFNNNALIPLSKEKEEIARAEIDKATKASLIGKVLMWGVEKASKSCLKSQVPYVLSLDKKTHQQLLEMRNELLGGIKMEQ